MVSPLVIGMVADGPGLGPDSPVARSAQLRIDRENALGGIAGRELQLVVEVADGAHEGLPEHVVTAWRRLAGRRDVLGVIGPAITDNVLVLVEEVAAGGLPTLHWAGTEHARNEWYFQFQVGSLTDEGPALVDALLADGHRRVGVLTAGTVGDEYFESFLREAQIRGLQLVGLERAHIQQDDVTDELDRLRANGPDAVVFLGMAAPGDAFVRGTGRPDWDVPRYGNIALFSAIGMPDVAEGLVWVDQYEPENPVLQEAVGAYAEASGPFPPMWVQFIGWDMATLMIEGLRRAPNLSRTGLKQGLERVRQGPCATGGRAPVMGFGHVDRAAIKGPDLLMSRTIRDGKPVSYHPGSTR